MAVQQKPHSQESLTVAEAASLLGRSKSWVYDQLITRSLDTMSEPGPTRITVASIIEYQRRKRRYDQTRTQRRRHRRNRSPLRLVIDNT